MKTGTKRETSRLALAASSQDRLTPIVHRSRRSVQTICISHGGVSTRSALHYDGHLGNNTEYVTMESCCIVIQVAGIVASPLPADPPVTRRRTFNTRWPHRSGWTILGVHIVASCEGVCALELSIGQQLSRCGGSPSKRSQALEGVRIGHPGVHPGCLLFDRATALSAIMVDGDLLAAAAVCTA